MNLYLLCAYTTNLGRYQILGSNDKKEDDTSFREKLKKKKKEDNLLFFKWFYDKTKYLIINY